jgi:hypothetical protein
MIIKQAHLAILSNWPEWCVFRMDFQGERIGLLSRGLGTGWPRGRRSFGFVIGFLGSGLGVEGKVIWVGTWWLGYLRARWLSGRLWISRACFRCSEFWLWELRAYRRRSCYLSWRGELLRYGQMCRFRGLWKLRGNQGLLLACLQVWNKLRKFQWFLISQRYSF